MLISSFCDLKKLAVRTTVLVYVLFVPLVNMTQAQTAALAQQTADDDYQTGAVLWIQSSAEYRALAYQAFSLARLRLDQVLIHRNSRRPAKPSAVIVDVDETVMDNSRFQAELILRAAPYTSEAWRAWVDRAEAGTVPGALEFLNYASRHGVSVFYITNRRDAEKAATITNLRKLGFPKVSEETVIVREQGTTASKESRRQKVSLRYRIVLLVGDNLNDFDDTFANKSIRDRKAQVDSQRCEFGTRYIVVPNAMYGDWESAVYEYKSNLTESERRAMRKAALRGITVQPGP